MLVGHRQWPQRFRTSKIAKPDGETAMQAAEDVGFMGAVAVPSVQHLLNGSLDALREAINSASVEEEPTRWVVSHIILGSALRMRASRAADDVRAHMYAEALDAFDTALAACAEKR